MLIRFRFPTALLILTAGLNAVPAAENARTASTRPNIVLIMADDLGLEGLGCYGGTTYSTPVFDRLATQGMRFTMCYSQPLCTPSRNKIMTGRSNARNYRSFGALDSGEITFGTIMKNAGYHTAIAGKWQLAGSEKPDRPPTWGTTPAACGFDESCMWAYEQDLAPADAETYFRSFPGSRQKTSRFWNPAILENGKYRPTTINDFGPDIYTEFLLEFIKRQKSEPFFVYYPMTLTHDPFVPTPLTPGLSDNIKLKNNPRYFGDMIRYTGLIVERFLNRLDELGLAENTLVLFTTDNGTRRSIVSHMGDRIVVGGKGLPVDAGCHVPLLAWWKGTVFAGSVSQDLVDFSDFLPTIAELGHAQLPSDRELDGTSFVPLLHGKPGRRSSVFVHYDKSPDVDVIQTRRIRFAFDGRYKLYLDGRMYDTVEDIEEEHALDTSRIASRATRPELVASRQSLRRVLDSMPPWQPDNSHLNNGLDQFTQQRQARLKTFQETGR